MFFREIFECRRKNEFVVVAYVSDRSQCLEKKIFPFNKDKGSNRNVESKTKSFFICFSKISASLKFHFNCFSNYAVPAINRREMIFFEYPNPIALRCEIRIKNCNSFHLETKQHMHCLRCLFSSPL